MSLPEPSAETIETTCPECGLKSRFPTAKRGMTVACAVCSAQVGVGLRTALPVDAAPLRFKAVSQPVRPKSPRLAVVAGLALLGGGGVAAGVYFGSSAATEVAAVQPVDPVEDVRVNLPPKVEPKPAVLTPLQPAAADTTKSLVPTQTFIPAFRDAVKEVPKAPERKSEAPPIAVEPTPEVKVEPVPAKPPMRESEVPPAPAVPIVVRVPMLLPKPGRAIPVHVGNAESVLSEYESAIGTLKAKDMVDRRLIELVAVPMEVKVEGKSADKEFSHVRATGGKLKGKFMIVRTAHLTLPK